MHSLDPRKQSALEALITELTGDVGALHNSVKRLKDDLPSMLSQVSNTADQVAVQRIEKRLVDAAKQLNESVAGLRSAADLEMKRAGSKAVSELSGQVVEIAKRIAADAAAAERSKAFYVAILAAVVGAALCVGVGAAAGIGLSKLEIASIQQKADARIAQAEKNTAWMKTAEGQAAMNLVAMGEAQRLSDCSGEGWKKERTGKLGLGQVNCIPYPLTTNNQHVTYGWRIKE